MRLSGTKTGAINQYRGLGNQLWDLAGNRPSLDLRFAENKSLVDATTGANLVDFTRASSGTYVDSEGVIQIASTDEPRFDHDPTTGESLGLLVEESRTNSFEWSNSATQGETWNNVGTQLNLASGQSDPAGGTAGIRATDANSGSSGTFLQRTSLANLTASTTVTYSVWLKPIDCPNNVISFNVFANTATDAINANFSVSGTTITAVSTSANGTGAASGASFEVFPNGWYLCRLTGVPSTVTMADVRARISLGSYQRAAGTARFDWYGAQFESSAFATSYIPTSGTAATRAADVASISGSNFSSWYRQDEGTMFYDGQVLGTESGNKNLLGLSTGSGSNVIDLFIPSGINQRFRMVTGGVQQVLQNAIPPADVYSPAKVAYAFKLDDTTSAGNGTVQSTDTSCTIPTVDRFTFGLLVTGEAQAAARFKRLTYWPARLPNETLQTITQ